MQRGGEKDLPKPVVRTSALDVAARLAELGLTPGLLRTALERAHWFASECTENHPVTARGFYVWSEANRELRDALVPEGWERQNEHNVPTTVSPDGRDSIYAVAGTDATGNPDRTPTTQNAPGVASIDLVDQNLQFELFADVEPALARPLHPVATWFLLHYRHGDVIRCELSLPTTVRDGVITRWSERIMLPGIDLTGGPTSHSQPEPLPDDDLDIPVQRRG